VANVLIDLIQLGRENLLDKWGIYHYGGYPHVSWYDFAIEILNEAASQGICKMPLVHPISSMDYVTPAKRPSNSRLDCKKINSTWGVTPSDWKLALKSLTRYVEHLK
jgi:dTDP-4-dehydrorhamnose reductase